MTSRERVLDTMQFKKTDRIPFSVLNGQGWICSRKGLTAAQLLELPDAGAELLVEAYKEIGTEILTTGCAAAWPMISAMGGKVDMNCLAAEIIEHPIAELSEIRDFDINEVISRMRGDYYYQRTLIQARRMRDIIGDEMLIGGGFFGPFTIAAQMTGVENFMMELLEAEKEDILYALDFASEIVIAYLEDLVENGLDLITVPEPVASGDLIRPDTFAEYVLPIDMKVKQRLSGKCDNALIHICGKTDGLVSIIAEKQYGIFSVDSIDMLKAQNDSAGKAALFGNLNPSAILVSKTADEVYEISKKLCSEMKPYGGFILAPGCDLAPEIPLENLQAMAKAARES